VQYHPEDFLRLAQTVEEEGGVMLGDSCQPKPYRLPIKDQITGEERQKQYFTAGCGKDALFAIPYRRSTDEPGERNGIIRVCAVDDDLGKWPRFQNAMEEDSF
jgi:hypothetical protein